MVDKELRARIEQAEWDNIIPLLSEYAQYKVMGLYLSEKSTLGGTYLNDIVNDIVMSAITKLLNGDRSWDIAKHPDMIDLLKSVVDSDVSHICDKNSYKITKRFPTVKTVDSNENIEVEEFLSKASPAEDHTKYLPSTTPLTPEDELISSHAYKFEEETWVLMLKVVEGDDELEDIILCIEEGYLKRREFAEQLGITPTEVDNRKKRLKRKYKDFFDEHMKGDS